MDILQQIRTSGKKGKDLNFYVAKLIKDYKPSAQDFDRLLNEGKDTERGVCVEALEYLTQTKPQIAKPYLDTVIRSLSDKAPRVKWEAARVVANLANTFPQDVESAVSGLVKNTADKGTVVRWSAAFALGQIAKSNPSLRNRLVDQIKILSQKEENSGVKNVYLKALKQIDN